MEKPILDACCGGRTFWFDKHNPHAVYVDKRTMERRIIWTSKDGEQTREFEVQPDIVADFKSLPFPDNTFWHVVFDPPHLTWAGETSWLAMKYGRLDKNNWKEEIGEGFRECMRVLKPFGTLIFKWNETNITVSEIIKVCGQEPLYGHRSGKGGKTHWLAFMKLPMEDLQTILCKARDRAEREFDTKPKRRIPPPVDLSKVPDFDPTDKWKGGDANA